MTDVTVGPAAVVNVHVTGVIAALPPAVAPDTVTVYVVAGASAALGVNVAMVAAAAQASVARAPSRLPASWMVVEPLDDRRSNVTETFVPIATPVAFAAGAASSPTARRRW